MKAVDAYLVASGAVFLAWGAVAAVTVVGASLHGWSATVPVNGYGEGVIELVLTLLALPGVVVLCGRALSLMASGGVRV